MNRNVVLTILVVLVLIAGAAGVGYYAYTAGYTQGLVQGGKIEVVVPNVEGGAVRPFAYGGPGFGGWGGWGGPFAFFRCLIPLFFFFLIFGAFRFFLRPWGWRHHDGWRGGPWEKDGVPPRFEEWHKRAHDAKPGQTADASHTEG